MRPEMSDLIAAVAIVAIIVGALVCNELGDRRDYQRLVDMSQRAFSLPDTSRTAVGATVVVGKTLYYMGKHGWVEVEKP